MTEILFELQGEGDIPPEPDVEVCDDQHVTLLGQRAVAGLVPHGRIGGHALGRVRAELIRDRRCRKRLELIRDVVLGPVRVFMGTVVYAEAISPVMSEELVGIDRALAYAGLKGARKQRGPSKKLHVTFLNARNGRTFSPAECRSIPSAIEGKLKKRGSRIVVVREWEPYPYDIFAT